MISALNRPTLQPRWHSGVSGDDGQLALFQGKSQRFGLPGAKPEVLNEAGDDFGLLDLHVGKTALLKSPPDKKAVRTVRITRGLCLDRSRYEGYARKSFRKRSSRCDFANRISVDITRPSSPDTPWAPRPGACARSHWHLSGNPARGLRVMVKKAKRDRWLSDGELATALWACDELSDRKAADVYRLILYSMCRPGEAAYVCAEDLLMSNGERV